jgi:hypothetical protein
LRHYRNRNSSSTRWILFRKPLSPLRDYDEPESVNNHHNDQELISSSFQSWSEWFKSSQRRSNFDLGITVQFWIPNLNCECLVSLPDWKHWQSADIDNQRLWKSRKACTDSSRLDHRFPHPIEHGSLWDADRLIYDIWCMMSVWLRLQAGVTRILWKSGPSHATIS